MQLATLCTPLYLIQIVRVQLALGLYIAPYNSQFSAILPQLCTFFTRDGKVARLAIFSGHHTAFYTRACIFVICCPLGRACLRKVLEWECSLYKAAHHSIFKSKSTFSLTLWEKIQIITAVFPLCFPLGYEYWMVIYYIDNF